MSAAVAAAPPFDGHRSARGGLLRRVPGGVGRRQQISAPRVADLLPPQPLLPADREEEEPRPCLPKSKGEKKAVTGSAAARPGKPAPQAARDPAGRDDAALRTPAPKPSRPQPRRLAQPSSKPGTPAVGSARPSADVAKLRNHHKRQEAVECVAPASLLRDGPPAAGRGAVPAAKNNSRAARHSAGDATQAKLTTAKPVKILSGKPRRRSYSAVEGREHRPLGHLAARGAVPTSTDAALRYAGPTFHNSPAPSDLPLPAFREGGGPDRTTAPTSTVSPSPPTLSTTPLSATAVQQFFPAYPLGAMSLSLPSTSRFLERCGNPFHPDRLSAEAEDEEIYCKALFTPVAFR